jgi:hypothetical protein
MEVTNDQPDRTCDWQQFCCQVGSRVMGNSSETSGIDVTYEQPDTDEQPDTAETRCFCQWYCINVYLHQCVRPCNTSGNTCRTYSNSTELLE